MALIVTRGLTFESDKRTNDEPFRFIMARRIYIITYVFCFYICSLNTIKCVRCQRE